MTTTFHSYPNHFHFTATEARETVNQTVEVNERSVYFLNNNKDADRITTQGEKEAFLISVSLHTPAKFMQAFHWPDA